MSLWVQLNEENKGAVLVFSQKEKLEFFLDEDWKINLFAEGLQVKSTQTVRPNQWTHLGFVLNAEKEPAVSAY